MEKGKCIPTDLFEIQALIGRFISLGAKNPTIFPTELIWDVKYGNPFVGSTLL